MSYFKFRWLLFLILFVIGGYYLLDFFSKLTDINIFSAISWGFRSKVSVGKGFSVWLFPFLAILFYPFLFTAVFLFLETPVQVYQMKKHHAGGLLGYRDEDKAHVYDPSRNTYITYEHLNPPPAADKFTEAFKVVLFYKFRPSSKYYKDTRLLSLSNQLTTLFVAAIGLLMIYISLYLLAEAYIEGNSRQINLSHHSMAIKFQEITGMSILMVLLIAVFVYLLFFKAAIVSVQIIRKYYGDLYKSHQQALRNKLLKSVIPMKTITGTVIWRDLEQKSRSWSEGSRDNKFHLVGRGSKTTYYDASVFTIEFRDLIQIPVYLNVTIHLSKSTKEDEDRLSRLFPDEYEDIPNKLLKFDFTVNPDYTISLKE